MYTRAAYNVCAPSGGDADTPEVERRRPCGRSVEDRSRRGQQHSGDERGCDRGPVPHLHGRPHPRLRAAQEAAAHQLLGPLLNTRSTTATQLAVVSARSFQVPPSMLTCADLRGFFLRLHICGDAR
eukprot:8692920-Pyramimonas_sp.AAC.1